MLKSINHFYEKVIYNKTDDFFIIFKRILLFLVNEDFIQSKRIWLVISYLYNFTELGHCCQEKRKKKKIRIRIPVFMFTKSFVESCP